MCARRGSLPGGLVIAALFASALECIEHLFEWQGCPPMPGDRPRPR